jgi:hypothetical protein
VTGFMDKRLHRAPRTREARRWLPSGPLRRRSRGLLLGGVWLHCIARWRAADLDRRLADGADPMESDELSLRVGRLGSAAHRTRIATALRRAVQIADGHHAPLVTTRLRRPEIHENEELLLAIADRLRDGEPLGVRGLAMTSRLVSDRAGPLYRPGAGCSLSVAACEALAALERGRQTVQH